MSSIICNKLTAAVQMYIHPYIYTDTHINVHKPNGFIIKVQSYSGSIIKGKWTRKLLLCSKSFWQLTRQHFWLSHPIAQEKCVKDYETETHAYRETISIWLTKSHWHYRWQAITTDSHNEKIVKRTRDL